MTCPLCDSPNGPFDGHTRAMCEEIRLTRLARAEEQPGSFDPVGLIASLSPSDRRRLIAATRKVAGPWEENPYDRGHQWTRRREYDGRHPRIGVLRDRDRGGGYRVMTFDAVLPTSHENLAHAMAEADDVYRTAGWILLEDENTHLEER